MASAWDRLQNQAFQRIVSEARHVRRLVATAPTGFGKTRLAQMLIRYAEQHGRPWVFYTHRRLLFSQTHEVFMKSGIPHGCRASGYPTALVKNGQLAMVQSERAAVLGRQERSFHNASLVIWDEVHTMASGFAADLHQWHADQGAFQVGFTATPVGLGDLYQKLCMLARNSDLRAVGGIVEAEEYAPSEVDLSDIKKVPGENFPKSAGKRFMVQQVVDSVIDRWLQLNPDHLPTLLFAPGVKESIWFTDQFLQRGISAAHIDGENIYLGERTRDGSPVVHKSDQAMRDEVAKGSRNGNIKVVCNRFVMREGVDWPWLAHGIWACSMGTEDGWVQSGGRILRAYPGLSKVVIQDHGGNWWRHLSLNIDREWSLQDTSKSRERENRERQEGSEEEQDMCCPNCKRLVKRADWAIANCCPFCGHKFKRSVREVLETGGKLKKVSGPAVNVKRRYTDVQREWNNVYFPSKNSEAPRNSNFKTLAARFHKNNPHYRLVRRGGKTCVKDLRDGACHYLHNAPPPDSAWWHMDVRSTPRNELQ